MGTIADHLRALRDQVEFYDALSDFIRLVDAVEELERVNDDLEDQIHEEGGFIDQIVELEAENARLNGLLDEFESDRERLQNDAGYLADRLIAINTWLANNDHRLPDGGEALWKIFQGETDD